MLGDGKTGGLWSVVVPSLRNCGDEPRYLWQGTDYRTWFSFALPLIMVDGLPIMFHSESESTLESSRLVCPYADFGALIALSGLSGDVCNFCDFAVTRKARCRENSFFEQGCRSQTERAFAPTFRMHSGGISVPADGRIGGLWSVVVHYCASANDEPSVPSASTKVMTWFSFALPQSVFEDRRSYAIAQWIRIQSLGGGCNHTQRVERLLASSGKFEDACLCCCDEERSLPLTGIADGDVALAGGLRWRPAHSSVTSSVRAASKDLLLSKDGEEGHFGRLAIGDKV